MDNKAFMLRDLALQVPKGEVIFIGDEEDILKIKDAVAKLSVAKEALKKISKAENYKFHYELGCDAPCFCLCDVARDALAEIEGEK